MTQPVQLAIDAAREGGKIVSRFFHDGVAMRSKGKSFDLVSDADVSSERCIFGIIRDAFPDHSVLGEEESSAVTDVEHLWIIDPLDGTTNFAHQIPHFAVSVGYYHHGIAQCGVVWNPIREDLYVASRGQGATHNGKAIHVGTQDRMSESLIGIGFYYDRGAMMEATLAAIGDCFRRQIHGVRRFGTASLDLAAVATGSYGAYFEYQLAPWDFAAGRLILEEAGGRISTCSGDDLPLTKTHVLASNGLLHDEMLAIVRKHLPAAFPGSSV